MLEPYAQQREMPPRTGDLFCASDSCHHPPNESIGGIMPATVDPRIREMAERFISETSNKRAVAVLKVLLDKGSISTDEIAELGYNHPPRAPMDVKDAGIPLVKDMVTSEKTGRRMAVYRFGDPSKIQEGRLGGRAAFPKTFKPALIARYGSIDCITGAKLDARALQIDHRVPYQIAGDAGLADHDIEEYMLLDASSQRAKSWSCEHCPNMEIRDEAICRTCYWAFPESHEHVATLQIRRTDVAFQGDDVAVHDRMREIADKRGVDVRTLLLELARQSANSA